jgi:hypothetical protein
VRAVDTIHASPMAPTLQESERLLTRDGYRRAT